ncbi:uncharacterized protein PG986_001214 [Apiospora aurea]|uniref:Uncharacterized protein n=1 Tax=Apiospora aurea TaxID=335848 RepID=A0ABR1QW64_9PEZI
MIDFGPDVESPMHRAVSLDYGIVVDGVFELILDSGGEADHAARGRNGTMPGRMMWFLLDCHDVYVDGKKMEGYLGDLAKEYVDQGVSK